MNLTGQIFIMPMHFILLMVSFTQRKSFKGATIVLTTTNGSNRYSVDILEFINSFRTTDSASDSDVCLVKLECAQKMSKGTLPYFLTAGDYDNLLRTTSFAGQIVGSYHPSGLTTLGLRNHYAQVSLNKGSINISAIWEDNTNSIYQLQQNFMYRWDGSRGDCGSMLVVGEGNFSNRILCGMHVAGGDGNGFSTVMIQENLQTLIEETFGKELSFDDEELPSFLLDNDYEAQGGLQPIFKLQPKYVPMEPYKSEIRKSRLFKQLPNPYHEVNSLPAKIKPFYDKNGFLIDPLEKAFNKYGKVSPDLDIKLVSESIESYENLFLQCNTVALDYRKIYDVRTVLHSFENINSIASSTSSGFPMSTSCEIDLKKEYYQACHQGDEQKMEDAYLRIANLVESTLDLYRSGIRPFFAYKQCGKDETRELHKVLEGKTRLFSLVLLYF
jgi:hypothetical protein